MRNRRKETKKRNDTYVIVKLFIQGYSGDSIKLANRFVIYFKHMNQLANLILT